MTTTHAPRLLVVDDDPVQLSLSRDLLTAAGYEVTIALGAAHALHLAGLSRPDVVLSDVVMPDVDGFTLCRLLRASPDLAGVPVVLASAYISDSEDRALAARAGASAVVERTPMCQAEIQAVNDALEQGTALPAPDATPCGGFAERMAQQLSQFLSRTHRAEDRCRVLLDYASEAIALTTPAGIILEINRKWENIRQLPRADVIGRSLHEFIGSPANDATPVIPIVRADGSTMHMEFTSTSIAIDGADLVLSIGHDVTEAVEVRRKLQASEEQYRTLVENMPDVVWQATIDGRMLFLSRRVTEICGFSPEEILAAPPSFLRDRIHPDDSAQVRSAYDRITVEGSFEAEYRWLRADGEWIWVHARAVVISHGGQPVVEGTITDVSERRRLLDQVRQSQKMEAIGLLTGGIAHDFNNLLAIILGNGRMLLDELPEGDPRREDGLAIVDAGERAAALTRQLLMFSRPQIVRPERIDVNVVVTGVEPMLQRLIGEDVDLSLHITGEEGTVLADAGEIEQVLMNLVINARDAMPGGGCIAIETKHVELDADYAALHDGITPGRYLMLSVTDTGCGMDAGTMSRAFEPFFTTKEVGRGTGLGLATCYGIVKRCGGHIAIYTEVGRGTAFKVYLPPVDGCALTRPAVAEPLAAGTETILLVEDDDHVRRSVHRVLAGRGYQVLDARDGDDALAVCAGHKGPINLLLSDMVMPGLSGPESAARICAHRPETRLLFMSGYSDHVLLQDGTAEHLNFIQKPFMPQALALKVREVLDAR